VPNLRTTHTDENLCAKGAYVIRSVPDKRDVTLLATGSEVGLAVEAAEALEKDGIHAAVVSMPCFELFRQQPETYRKDVLGTAPRIGIEAAVEQGWHEWLDKGDIFIGLSNFGASAPAAQVYQHFGVTAARVIDAARKLAAKRS
jgi:transketolase